MQLQALRAHVTWLNIHPAAETAAVGFAIGTAAVASANFLNTTTLPSLGRQLLLVLCTSMPSRRQKVS